MPPPPPLNTNFLDLLLLTRRYNTENPTQPQFTTHISSVTRRELATLEASSTTRFQDDIDRLIFHLLRIRRHEQAGESKNIEEDIVDLAQDVNREHTRLVQRTERNQREAAARREREDQDRRGSEQRNAWELGAMDMRTQVPATSTPQRGDRSHGLASPVDHATSTNYFPRARFPQQVPGPGPNGYFYHHPLIPDHGRLNRRW